jgi:hypothetical protein
VRFLFHDPSGNLTKGFGVQGRGGKLEGNAIERFFGGGSKRPNGLRAGCYLRGIGNVLRFYGGRVTEVKTICWASVRLNRVLSVRSLIIAFVSK